MIGIVYIDGLWGCPYLDKYTEILKQNYVEYEVVFWERENKIINYDMKYQCFNKKSKYNKHPIFKIKDFWDFSRWVKNVISNQKYDKLIVLSTLSGMIIAKTLLNEYKGKYIFDIRDYSYENTRPFYKLEERLIKSSYFTCISSEGFKQFLPHDYQYLMAHNFNYGDLMYRKKFKKKDKNAPITVAFNGSIRYFEHQSKIIDRLKNDPRFKMVYHGIGPELEMFKTHCSENKITNIVFSGEYKNADKYKLLYEADILNNSYGTKKVMEVKYAISNKYYDGLVFGIPQLVEINTSKEAKVKEVGVGIGLDAHDEDFADKLYKYYHELDENKFNESCEKEIDKILKDDQLYLEKIRKFIESSSC